jgi:hypothetical protein
MKVVVNEHDHSFNIVLTAESMADMSSIVRLGMNSVKAVTYKQANVYQGGAATMDISFDKRRNAGSIVPVKGVV